jgi:hypothetical protein
MKTNNDCFYCKIDKLGGHEYYCPMVVGFETYNSPKLEELVSSITLDHLKLIPKQGLSKAEFRLKAREVIMKSYVEGQRYILGKLIGENTEWLGDSESTDPMGVRLSVLEDRLAKIKDL